MAVPDWLARKMDPELRRMIMGTPGELIKITVEMSGVPSPEEFERFKSMLSSRFGARVTGSAGRNVFIVVDEHYVTEIAKLPQVAYLHRPPPGVRPL